MKKIFSATVALAVMAIFASSAQAVIIIDEAIIENGQVFIAGAKAPKGKPISWEGVALGINSSNGGSFHFNTTNLPPDCVGLLTIDTEERDVVINNCTLTTAGVPKTGQTTSYAPGDDGDLKNGVALPTPRFTDNGNGTITDNLTGLIWLKNANCIRTLYPGFDTDEIAGDGLVAWQYALDFVAGINAGTYGCGDTSNGGSSQMDWRLPNVRELFSLMNFEYNRPAISNAAGTGHGSGSDPFSNLEDDPFGTSVAAYWSSTANIFADGNAWLVNFDTGIVGNGVKTLGRFYVIAVRGGS